MPIFVPIRRLSQLNRIGYLDARGGRAFHRDYNRWTEGEQKSYESGRLLAVKIKAATIEVPDWPADQEIPREVGIAILAAERASA